MTSETTVDHTPEAIPLRPLGLVKNIVERLDLEVTYVYEDLVFIEHNAFLLQMGADHGEDLFVWFNEESTPDDRPQILLRLVEEGQNNGMRIQEKGTYSLTGEGEDDAIQLHFSPLEE